MKKEHVSSLKLPKGFLIEQYETSDEGFKEVLADAGSLARVVHIVNMDRRQKSCLVEGRDKLAEAVYTKTNFQPIWDEVEVETEKEVDGKKLTEKSTKQVWNEPEAKYLDRFVAAVANGEFTAPGFTVDQGAEADKKIDSLWMQLQHLADKIHLRVTAKETPKAERKTKEPNEKWLALADQNILNGSQEKAEKIFKKDGIEFEPFRTEDKALNRVNLANAIKAHMAWREKNTYA
jgi:hypothetical protein